MTDETKKELILQAISIANNILTQAMMLEPKETLHRVPLRVVLRSLAEAQEVLRRNTR